MRLRLRVLAVLSTLLTGAGFLAAPPAGAVGESANATAIKSTLLDLALPIVQANCPGPPNSPQTIGPITLGLINIGVATAQCTTTTASSSVASVRIFDPSDPNNTVILDGIASACNATTGQATSTVTLKLGNTGLFAGPITSATALQLGALGIFLNEPVNADGFFGANAVRIQLAGPEQKQDLILAQSRCALPAPTPSTAPPNLVSDALSLLFP